MKILVTGGAGFIGSHLCEYYLNLGHDVWAIDCLSTGKSSNLPKHSRLKFTEGRISRCAVLDEAIDWADCIFHAAATVGMRNVLEHPIETLTNNLHALESLFEVLADYRTKRFLFLSSSGVYWNSKSDTALREDATLIVHPELYVQEPYSLSKMTGEVLTLNFGKKHSIFVTVARIFNTVGVRQTGQYGMVVPRFINWALKDEPIYVHGDGKQTRSFCNVHDTVEALSQLIECKHADRQIVNVGNDREISIYELAELVKKVLNSKSEIIFQPYKEAFGFDFVDVKNRKPCLEKLQSLTGFKAKWSLEETIAEIASTLSTVRP